jgi:hypothetical protein
MIESSRAVPAGTAAVGTVRSAAGLIELSAPATRAHCHFGGRRSLESDAMQIKFQIFKSYTQSWENLCAEAAAFATSQGRERLINISVSEDDNQGVIVVWYWE